MRVVVADTGPLRYLLAIGHIDILPQLFESIAIPTTVHDELRHPSAPALVRHWAGVLDISRRQRIWLR